MRFRSFLMTAAAFAGSVMLSANAMATPIVVDGITLPAYSDGNLSVGLSDHETKVTSVGDILKGTGVLTSIAGGLNQTYANGFVATSTGKTAPDGIITDVFDGFKVRDISFAPADPKNPAGLTTISFTGGSLNLYVQPKIPNTSTVTLSAALANAGKCVPVAACTTGAFLELSPETLDTFGDTFIVTIAGSSLSNFTISNGTAYLDVVGGDAASYFDTNSIANGSLLADLGFAGNAASGSFGTAFKVGGTDSMYNKVGVPEPLTLSLFGAGLVGLAGIRRKKKNRKA